MAEITSILEKLIERTDQGKVPWKKTSIDKTFLVVFGNSSVTISLVTVPEEPDPLSFRGTRGSVETIELKVLNKEGRELEDISGIGPSGARYKDRLMRLFREARRVALGVDSQLDELLKELG